MNYEANDELVDVLNAIARLMDERKFDAALTKLNEVLDEIDPVIDGDDDVEEAEVDEAV